MSKNPVVHFEMPYTDADRVNKFYNSVFGWKMNDIGPSMGNYIVAHTAETDQKNMVKTPGTINGGFFQKSSSNNPYPSVVVSVEDIDMAMAAVKKEGGEIVGRPEEIPGIGMWVVFIDSEGNKVSMLQSKK